MSASSELVYTCAGPERVPARVEALFEAAGRHFAEEGYLLRCAGTPGVDAALRAGARSAEGAKEKSVDVLVPWRGYRSRHEEPPPADARIYEGEAWEAAARHHPDWGRLRESVRRVEAARTARVTGGEARPAATFVLCWTPGGAKGPKEIRPWTGAARQVIRTAAGEGIPVVNTKRDASRARIAGMLGEKAPPRALLEANPDARKERLREMLAAMRAEAEAQKEAAEERPRDQRRTSPQPPRRCASASAPSKGAQEPEEGRRSSARQRKPKESRQLSLL